MARPQITVKPDWEDPESLVAAIRELQDIVSSKLSPGSPSEDVLTIPVNGTRPKQLIGRPENFEGSWTEVHLDGVGDLNANLKVVHNMGMPPTAAAASPQNQRLNVTWDVKRVRWSGTPPGADTRVLVAYVDGVVGTDDIELRFFSNITPTATHPLRVALLFYPAEA